LQQLNLIETSKPANIDKLLGVLGTPDLQVRQWWVADGAPKSADFSCD
jgi:hypothetical protein